MSFHRTFTDLKAGSYFFIFQAFYPAQVKNHFSLWWHVFHGVADDLFQFIRKQQFFQRLQCRDFRNVFFGKCMGIIRKFQLIVECIRAIVYR